MLDMDILFRKIVFVEQMYTDYKCVISIHILQKYNQFFIEADHVHFFPLGYPIKIKKYLKQLNVERIARTKA